MPATSSASCRRPPTTPETLIKSLAVTPFDLRTDAPLRVGLTSVGTAHTVVLVVHHIAADGASMPIVVADLIAAYRERVGGRTRGWQPARIDYRDYAVRSHDRCADDDLRFTDRLRGAPAQTSPDADHGICDQPGGATLSLPIDPDLRDAVAEFARDNTTSVFTVLHTALVILLHRLGVGHDIVVGSPVANRSAGRRGLPRNRRNVRQHGSPAHRRRSGGDRAERLLDAVRDADLDTWEHLDAPFDDVIARVNCRACPVGIHNAGGVVGARLRGLDHRAAAADRRRPRREISRP